METEGIDALLPHPPDSVVPSMFNEETEKPHGPTLHQPNEQLPSSLYQELVTSVNAVLTAIDKIRVKVELMENKLDVFERSTADMKGSLRLIETIVCMDPDGIGVQRNVNTNNVHGSMVNSETSHLPGLDKPASTVKDKQKKARSNRYDDINNIVLDVSDEDEELPLSARDIASPNCVPYKLPHLTQQRPRQQNLGKSRLMNASIKPSTHKPLHKESSKPSSVGRKHFRNPSPMLVGAKFQRTEYPKFLTSPQTQTIRHTEVKPNFSLGHRSAPNSYAGQHLNRRFGQTMLMNSPGGKVLKSNFVPPPEMNISELEDAVIAYVFSCEHDPGEVLLKFGNHCLTRERLQCMCPGKIVNDEIIELMAVKATWDHQHSPAPSIWCLPPSFADDVFRSCGIDELLKTYVNPWMQPMQNLKYIYVPVKEDGSYWYLMVVSLRQQIIYHLDSFLPLEKVKQRRQAIQTLGEVLSNMMSSDYYPRQFYNPLTELQSWEIMEGRGIPNCEHSDNSALWVLDWMCMDSSFQSNLFGMINENMVRMTVALALLLASCNERKKWIESRASSMMETCSQDST